MFKIKKPSEFKNVEQRFNSHTLNEILPYLPDEDCFFDTRHWTCDTTDGILPFAVTTDISRNAQQFLKEMKKVLPLNADEQGLCRTLNAQYYKNGRANFLKSDGGTFAATGVIEYMSEIKHIGQMSSSQNSRVIDPKGISYAVTNGHKDGEPKIIEAIGCSIRGRNPENPSERGRSNGKYKQRLEKGSNISNAITTVQKDALVAESIIIDDYNQRVPQYQDVIGTVTTQFGNPEPRHDYKIAKPLRIPQATEKGYIELEPGGLFDGSYPNSTTSCGRVQDGGKPSPTLMANGEPPSYYEGKVEQSFRIRKLTPRECFRLMGVSEVDIDKIQQSGVSQSQQYKMAGNSIVVDVLEHIFRKMFVDTGQESQQLSLF